MVNAVNWFKIVPPLPNKAALSGCYERVLERAGALFMLRVSCRLPPDSPRHNRGTNMATIQVTPSGTFRVRIRRRGFPPSQRRSRIAGTDLAIARRQQVRIGMLAPKDVRVGGDELLDAAP